MIHRKAFWYAIADEAVRRGLVTQEQADASALRILQEEQGRLEERCLEEQESENP